MARELRTDELIDNSRPEVVGYQDAGSEEGTGAKANHAREGTPSAQ
jgi:hypothetical protein